MELAHSSSIGLRKIAYLAKLAYLYRSQWQWDEHVACVPQLNSVHACIPKHSLDGGEEPSPIREPTNKKRRLGCKNNALLRVIRWFAVLGGNTALTKALCLGVIVITGRIHSAEG